MNQLDERILQYLAQEQRGVGLTWLMAALGEPVNAVAAAVLRLEDSGLVSRGPNRLPCYRLAGCQEAPNLMPQGGFVGADRQKNVRLSPGTVVR